MDKLEIFRKQIDDIDFKIIQLLGKRFEIVKKVGEYKKQKNISFLQQGRWEQVISDRKFWAKKNNLSGEFIAEMWDKIHQYALKHQK